MIERSKEDPLHPRTNLSPNCGNCDSLIGYKEYGWCYRWDVFVHGHQDCPEWAIRDMEAYTPKEIVINNMSRIADALVSIRDIISTSEDENLKERYQITEVAIRKFLYLLQDKLEQKTTSIDLPLDEKS